MKLPNTLEAVERTINVYVGGPGYGEGVLLIIGKALAIGIDCCASFFQKTASKPSFLESKLDLLPLSAPLVWVLTHYHYDHFHCLPRVLTTFGERIGALLVPMDFTSADMSFLVDQLHEGPKTIADTYRERNEYKLLRALQSQPPFNRLQNRLLGTQQWLSFDLKSGRDLVPLRIRVCSSDSDVFDSHVAKSAKSVRDGENSNRDHANRGSYILHCQVGEFSGLFLGDAGTERIEQLTENAIIGPNGIDCLKVGHHGSLDATDERLLRICARPPNSDKEQHAVIAPFNRSSLPNPEVLELLDAFGYKVHLCDSGRGAASAQKIGSKARFLTSIIVNESQEHGSGIVSLNFSF